VFTISTKSEQKSTILDKHEGHEGKGKGGRRRMRDRGERKEETRIFTKRRITEGNSKDRGRGHRRVGGKRRAEGSMEEGEEEKTEENTEEKNNEESQS
jgi:hypothetical protein